MSPSSPLMKHLLLCLATACAVAAPVQAKTYGGFKPGKTFTFTVTARSSTKQVDLNPSVNVPVPAGVVKLGLGSKVRFTIGRKGQLEFKKSSFPYDSSGAEYVQYVRPPKNGLSQSGTIYKSKKGKPVGASLNFLKIITNGASRTVYAVDYQLE